MISPVVTTVSKPMVISAAQTPATQVLYSPLFLSPFTIFPFPFLLPPPFFPFPFPLFLCLNLPSFSFPFSLATKGWDAATGLGRPIFEGLLKYLGDDSSLPGRD